jgi:hypothetical protein
MITPPPGPVTGTDAQRAAVEELRHGEYHRGGPGLLDRILGWLGRHLDSAFGNSGGGHLGLVILAVVLVAVVFAVVKAGVPRRKARRDDGTDDDPLRPAGTTDHRRLAAELESQERLAEALREWLRAAVQAIEDRGVLAPRPGRTGAATAREAGPLLPSAAADLSAGMRAFDEIWFGGRDAGAEDVARARAAADGVRSGRIVHLTTSDGFTVPS